MKKIDHHVSSFFSKNSIKRIDVNFPEKILIGTGYSPKLEIKIIKAFIIFSIISFSTGLSFYLGVFISIIFLCIFLYKITKG